MGDLGRSSSLPRAAPQETAEQLKANLMDRRFDGCELLDDLFAGTLPI
jgi:hypothetical protein